jgi:hypothetical protein
LVCPSYSDFIAIVKNQSLPNVSITVKDVEHAEKIFGNESGSLQDTNFIEFPPVIMELQCDMTLAADIMNIAGMQFLITTSGNIQFTTVDRLENKEASTLKNGIESVVNLYKNKNLLCKTSWPTMSLKF